MYRSPAPAAAWVAPGALAAAPAFRLPAAVVAAEGDEDHLYGGRHPPLICKRVREHRHRAAGRVDVPAPCRWGGRGRSHPAACRTLWRGPL